MMTSYQDDKNRFKNGLGDIFKGTRGLTLIRVFWKKIQNLGKLESVIHGKKIQDKFKKWILGKPESVICGKKIQTFIMVNPP